jgi:hypothetical protein
MTSPRYGNSDDIDQLAIFRMSSTPVLRAYVHSQSDGWSEALNVKTPTALTELGLPAPFRIDARVPLPNSVPLEYLATNGRQASGGPHQMREAFAEIDPDWFASEASVMANAAGIVKAVAESPLPPPPARPICPRP